MARDVNDLVALGFGSWSDVTGLPTLGFGSAAELTDQHFDFLEALCTWVETTLGIPAYCLKVPRLRPPLHASEGVMLWPANTRIQDATNIQDDLTYGVGITCYIAGKQHLTANLQTLLYRRAQLLSLHNRPGSYVSQMNIALLQVEGGPALDQSAWVEMYDATTVVVLGIVRQLRD